jgi:hypothetical protein
VGNVHPERVRFRFPGRACAFSRARVDFPSMAEISGIDRLFGAALNFSARCSRAVHSRVHSEAAQSCV